MRRRRKNREISSNRGKWKCKNETISKNIEGKRRSKSYNIHNKLTDMDIQIYGK